MLIAIISEIFMSTLVKISRFRSRCKNRDLHPAYYHKCECPYWCFHILPSVLFFQAKFYAEMPTLPISSGGSRKFTPTPALTITLLILPKLRYFRSNSHWSVHIVCLLLSLSLFFFFIVYQTITSVWHFIALLSSGGTLQKLNHDGVYSLLAPVSLEVCGMPHTARTVFIMSVPLISRTKNRSSPHRSAKQLYVPIYSILC